MWDYRRWEFCAGKSDRSSKGQLTGRLSGRREQDLWGAFPQMSSSSHFEYYANTKEFYKSLATQSSLSASLQSAYSLGVTVSVATKSKSSQQSEVSGMSLIKQALTEKIHVDKECLVSDDISTLKGTFLNDLEDLPINVENPWDSKSWVKYCTVLEKYGSHVITSVKRGSKFQQMTFAE